MRVFSNTCSLRSWLCAVLLVCACVAHAEDWPQWNAFVERFVEKDGRVVDVTFGGKTTSEGQAYGLFFALVAGERDRFDNIFSWTSNNLAQGQLGKRLPGWLWGKRDDRSWGLKDKNSASDADLWIAYTLLQAGRLWNEPRYTDIGRQMLALIREHEIVRANNVGPVLLPAPIGFKLSEGRLRINPSYLPGFMFRYLASFDPDGPWQAVWDAYMKLAPQIYAAGVAPDRFIIDANGRVAPDTEQKPSASYDAIRVYLWAGMSAPHDFALIELLSGYAELVRQLGEPPEKVDPLTGVAERSRYSPIGFSGAVLPFLSAARDKTALDQQIARVRLADDRAKRSNAATNYYDQALILFGMGWLDEQFRFDDEGQLQPVWQRDGASGRVAGTPANWPN
jgi:endoglucanase